MLFLSVSQSRYQVLLPSSVPAGISTVTLSVVSSYPLPLHFGHLSLTISPSPPHFGHVWENVINPCFKKSCPLPPQSGHLVLLPPFAPEPSQSEHGFLNLKETSFFTPKIASVNSILSSIALSRLYLSDFERLLCPPPPPPKNESNIDSISPKSNPKPPLPPL